MALSDSAPWVGLEAIPFHKLSDLDPETLDQLLHAATNQGFFYLDLLDSPAEHILDNVDSLYCIASKLYSMPLEVKSRFDIDTLGPHKLNGYKPSGRNVGIEGNKKDGFEAWLIPRDGIATPAQDIPPPLLPQILDENLRFLSSLMDQLHTIAAHILRALSLKLGLPNDQSFEMMHRGDHSSTSALGLLRYNERPSKESVSAVKAELQDGSGHAAHTDVGSITLLFCNKPGLQILDSSHNKWMSVTPRKGCAIVNIGDSLRFLSGGRLQSCLHRVLDYSKAENATEEQRASTQEDTNRAVQSTGDDARYSCAYFLRPERDVTFNDDTGRAWTGIGWHEHKYGLFRADKANQEKDSYVLTGRKDYLGQWTPAEA